MNRFGSTPLGRVIPRHAAFAVTEALADTRVVLVNGARQGGKTTLAAQIGRDRGADVLSLDNPGLRQAAFDDPETFVTADVPLVIDEVQRVPDLVLAIKERVDADQRPGRFLLTGSARLLALRAVPDALPGRMETIELWPLSQGEIDGLPDQFVDAAFGLGPSLRHDSTLTRDDYIERLVRGGFPEAVARTGKRRERFFDAYVSDLINRDILQVGAVERGDDLRRLIRLLAARSGQLIVPGTIARQLGLSQHTVRRYLTLLEEVYLIKLVPAWSRNLSKRATGAAKGAFVDSGIAANLCGQNVAKLRRPDSTLGGLLEGFVTMEVARQVTWAEVRAELFHYRTKDQVEVDMVLESRSGQVVALEVKASATVRSEDFRGLRHLANRLGEDFVVGIVLYAGRRTLSFGDRMLAVPISAVWQVGTDSQSLELVAAPGD